MCDPAYIQAFIDWLEENDMEQPGWLTWDDGSDEADDSTPTTSSNDRRPLPSADPDPTPSPDWCSRGKVPFDLCECGKCFAIDETTLDRLLEKEALKTKQAKEEVPKKKQVEEAALKRSELLMLFHETIIEQSLKQESKQVKEEESKLKSLKEDVVLPPMGPGNGEVDNQAVKVAAQEPNVMDLDWTALSDGFSRSSDNNDQSVVTPIRAKKAEATPTRPVSNNAAVAMTNDEEAVDSMSPPMPSLNPFQKRKAEQAELHDSADIHRSTSTPYKRSRTGPFHNTEGAALADRGLTLAPGNTHVTHTSTNLGTHTATLQIFHVAVVQCECTIQGQLHALEYGHSADLACPRCKGAVVADGDEADISDGDNDDGIEDNADDDGIEAEVEEDSEEGEEEYDEEEEKLLHELSARVYGWLDEAVEVKESDEE